MHYGADQCACNADEVNYIYVRKISKYMLNIAENVVGDLVNAGVYVWILYTLVLVPLVL